MLRVQDVVCAQHHMRDTVLAVHEAVEDEATRLHRVEARRQDAHKSGHDPFDHHGLASTRDSGLLRHACR